MPGHDDHDLARRLREERVEASTESTPPEASEQSTPPEASMESTPPEASEGSTPPEASTESTPAERGGPRGTESTPAEASEQSTPPEASTESTPPDASEESTPPEASKESTPPEASEEFTPADASEESAPAEAQWILRVGLVLALVAGIAAFSGVGNVSTALRKDVLGALQQARDSSAAAIRSAVGHSVSGLGSRQQGQRSSDRLGRGRPQCAPASERLVDRGDSLGGGRFCRQAIPERQPCGIPQAVSQQGLHLYAERKRPRLRHTERLGSLGPVAGLQRRDLSRARRRLLDDAPTGIGGAARRLHPGKISANFSRDTVPLHPSRG